MWIIDQAFQTTYQKTITIKEHAKLRYCLIWDASQISLDVIHQGIGAESQITMLAFSKAGTSDAYTICSILEQAQTLSDVTMTTLLYSWSSSIVDGMVVIKPWADGSSGHLHEKNIVLWQPVNIHTLPQLDIHHHNVSAGHGATIDTIDDRNLFYLMSKGIDKQMALQLILQGVLEHSLAGYPRDDSLTNLQITLLDRIIAYQS